MPSNPITASLAVPEELERLYHNNPAQFSAHLYEALSDHPHAQILQFWRARLEFQKFDSSSSLSLQHLSRLLLLCLIATIFIKFPLIFPIAEIWYYTRFAPMIVAGSLIAYFMWRQLPSAQIIRAVCAAGVAIFATLLLLPDSETASSVIMAVLHAPLVLWSALGLTFTATGWRSSSARLDYLRYNGELFIYTVLILLGGIVLSVLTMGLFSLLNLDISQWYLDNIAAVGLVSAPLVATFVYDIVLARQSRLATLIANVFTPLFLVMITAYLIAMAIQQQSPYTNREFLILFNGLLLLVLAMTIFSIAGRNNRPASPLADAVNLGLITVTLLVNVVALSAIVYRLAEWGLTPNRVVVTGANLLIFVHLITIVISYIGVMRNRVEPSALARAVTVMLPVYSLWSVFVMIGLPILFGFQ